MRRGGYVQIPRREARLNGRRHLFQSLSCHLAIVALFAQLIAPVALASRPGVDVAGFLCAPLGTLSEEARAEAEALLSDLLGQQPEDDRSVPHCPFCVLVHGVPLPEHDLVSLVFFEHRDVATPSFETAFVYRPQGPPLGLRAPPSLSL